jgi:hypothetical protein
VFDLRFIKCYYQIVVVKTVLKKQEKKAKKDLTMSFKKGNIINVAKT